ncbi:uncharacterized protein BYT42DRAFT_569277 [Radiomyces spectabilis]|uniref:uncharacterized protein n=1 Tax=Radiomyces spectabilis TaxID=64574 RepID=UPI00221F1810|nr:uncharacterized protein BYT42DRAFT_569277 [Radiomyces spectabilis]KAI8379575.1 hypothetical protein BYT42DRAFT_569277 [Radiomyces spectabilis]
MIAASSLFCCFVHTVLVHRLIRGKIVSRDQIMKRGLIMGNRTTNCNWQMNYPGHLGKKHGHAASLKLTLIFD